MAYFTYFYAWRAAALLADGKELWPMVTCFGMISFDIQSTVYMSCPRPFIFLNVYLQIKGTMCDIWHYTVLGTNAALMYYKLSVAVALFRPGSTPSLVCGVFYVWQHTMLVLRDEEKTFPSVYQHSLRRDCW